MEERITVIISKIDCCPFVCKYKKHTKLGKRVYNSCKLKKHPKGYSHYDLRAATMIRRFICPFYEQEEKRE